MVLKLFYLPPVSFPRSEYPLRWGGGYPLLNDLQFDLQNDLQLDVFLLPAIIYPQLLTAFEGRCRINSYCFLPGSNNYNYTSNLHWNSIGFHRYPVLIFNVHDEFMSLWLYIMFIKLVLCIMFF